MDEATLERLKQEQSELKDRLIKLNAFLSGSKFPQLDDYNKSLLIRQREAMAVYFEIITARVSLNEK